MDPSLFREIEAIRIPNFGTRACLFIKEQILRHEPELAEQIPIPKENHASFVATVLHLYNLSKLKKEAVASFTSEANISPSSMEGDRIRRQHARDYAFYSGRHTQMASLRAFAEKLSTKAEVVKTRDAMIKEFSSAISTASHEYSPNFVTVFMMILRSIEDNGDINPTLLLTMCRWILSFAPPSQVFETVSWLNILPPEQFQSLMKGNHLPVDPDIRALEIGANVIKVKSFPLMPESEPWNLKSWNTAVVNQPAYAAASGGSNTAASGCVPVPRSAW